MPNVYLIKAEKNGKKYTYIGVAIADKPDLSLFEDNDLEICRDFRNKYVLQHKQKSIKPEG